MAKQKTYLIDSITDSIEAMLANASKKHKSITGCCILIEGDRFGILVPQYGSEKEKEKAVRKLIEVMLQNESACKEFARFVVPAYRYFEREKKKALKNVRVKE